MLKVYIAGPLTQGWAGANIRRALSVADQLASQGCAVFCPHLSFYWDMLHPHDYEFWLRQDFAWLEVVDAVVRVPGPSGGADREVARAQELGIPIFDWSYTEGNEELFQWVEA